MKKKVTCVEDAKLALHSSIYQNYDYEAVFEVGSGEFAVVWQSYPAITVILPSELELDAQGNFINPFSVARGRSSHPLITESNLEFSGGPVFNWCTLALERDDRIWLQLCDPQDATHILIYGFSKATSKSLGPDDDCSLSLPVFYKEAGNGKSTMVLPVGYIRLSYHRKYAEDSSMCFVYGADIKPLCEYYAERAKDFLTAAQTDLETQRSARKALANEIEKARDFSAKHSYELDELRRQSDCLASRANSYGPGVLTADQHQKYTSKIWVHPNNEACSDAKMHGYNQSFEFSEQGIKDLSNLIQRFHQEMDHVSEDRLRRERQQSIARRIAHAASDRHVRVFDSSSDVVYMKHKHGNYRNLYLSFNSDKVWIDAEGFASESYDLNEDGYEAILRELDLAIQQSKDYVCKAYVWIQNLFHRSEN